MVLATANTKDFERKELKSLEGAFVEIRRLTYGEKIMRQQMVSNFKIKAGEKRSDGFEGEMNLANEQATLFDFQHCIGDHNLERYKNPLDPESELVPIEFKKIEHIRSLDPRVGEEISTMLDELNNFEEDGEGDEGNLQPASGSTSSFPTE